MPSSAKIPRSCVPPAARTTFGAPSGGSALPSRSALFRKFTPSTIMHCSVAGSPSNVPAINGARVLLDDVVTGTGRYVIAVGPNGGPRLIPEEPAQDIVA